METRRAFAEIRYRDRDFPVLSFSHKDNNDITDGVSATVPDPDGQWLGSLFPNIGESFSAAISVRNWNHPGDNRRLELGSFDIDNPQHKGSFTLNALSVPISHSSRSERKNRAWRDISLWGIARDFSQNAGLVLFYDTNINPFYDTVDQNDKSDLAFFQELCKADGLSLKISNGQLVVFEEWKYEQLPAVMTISKGQGIVIGDPDFNLESKDIYRACEITYFNSSDDTTYIGFFEDPNAGGIGHILRLRERFNSEQDDINLDRKARARLRERNKNQWTCRMSVKGDITYFAGTNVNISGWHRFDGKYHIVSCTHNIGSSGYTVSLNLRRCLEGY